MPSEQEINEAAERWREQEYAEGFDGTVMFGKDEQTLADAICRNAIEKMRKERGI